MEGEEDGGPCATSIVPQTGRGSCFVLLRGTAQRNRKPGDLPILTDSWCPPIAVPPSCQLHTMVPTLILATWKPAMLTSVHTACTHCDCITEPGTDYHMQQECCVGLTATTLLCKYHQYQKNILSFSQKSSLCQAIINALITFNLAGLSLK